MDPHQPLAEKAVRDLLDGIEQLALILNPKVATAVLDDAIRKVNGKVQRKILQAAKQIAIEARK